MNGWVVTRIIQVEFMNAATHTHTCLVNRSLVEIVSDGPMC